eukprot:TRINITY_DN14351_c0_g1_i1.p1 TRINITY_DN14351_c0_g1~~TRINITY_DN14351_c0_g1_i1.p1  ORF type:complete len:1154 (+),score=261.56 TRINITY_DN14351_c0_g1_i1:44-3463(+)
MSSSSSPNASSLPSPSMQAASVRDRPVEEAELRECLSRYEKRLQDSIVEHDRLRMQIVELSSSLDQSSARCNELHQKWEAAEEVVKSERDQMRVERLEWEAERTGLRAAVAQATSQLAQAEELKWVLFQREGELADQSRRLSCDRFGLERVQTEAMALQWQALEQLEVAGRSSLEVAQQRDAAFLERYHQTQAEERLRLRQIQLQKYVIEIAEREGRTDLRARELELQGAKLDKWATQLTEMEQRMGSEMQALRSAQEAVEEARQGLAERETRLLALEARAQADQRAAQNELAQAATIRQREDTVALELKRRQEDLEQKSQELALLEEDSARREKQIEEKEVNISAREEHIIQQLARIETEQHALRKREEVFEEERQRILALEAELRTIQADIAQKLRDASAKRKQAEELAQSTATTAERQAQEHSAKLKSIEEITADLRLQRADHERRLQEIAQREGALQTRLKDLDTREKQLNTLSEAIDRQTHTHQIAQEKLLQVQTELREREATIQLIEQRISKEMEEWDSEKLLRKEQAAALAREKERELEIERRQLEVEERRREADRVLHELGQSRMDMAAEAQKLLESRKHLDKIRVELDKDCTRIAETKETLQQQQDKINEDRRLFAEDWEKLRQSWSQYTADQQTLQGAWVVLKEETRKVRVDQREQETRDALLREKQASVESAETAVETARRAIREGELALRKMREEAAAERLQLAETQGRFGIQLDELQIRQEEYRRATQEMASAVRQLHAETGRMRQHVAGLQKTVSSAMEQRLTQLEASYQTRLESEAAIGQSVLQHHFRIAQREREVEQLHLQCSRISASNEQQIQALQQHRAALEEARKTFTAEKGVIQERWQALHSGPIPTQPAAPLSAQPLGEDVRRMKAVEFRCSPTPVVNLDEDEDEYTVFSFTPNFGRSAEPSPVRDEEHKPVEKTKPAVDLNATCVFNNPEGDDGEETETDQPSSTPVQPVPLLAPPILTPLPPSSPELDQPAEPITTVAKPGKEVASGKENHVENHKNKEGHKRSREESREAKATEAPAKSRRLSDIKKKSLFPPPSPITQPMPATLPPGYSPFDFVDSKQRCSYCSKSVRNLVSHNCKMKQAAGKAVGAVPFRDITHLHLEGDKRRRVPPHSNSTS